MWLVSHLTAPGGHGCRQTSVCESRKGQDGVGTLPPLPSEGGITANNPPAHFHPTLASTAVI